MVPARALPPLPGRKMRVYQREEATGGPEPQAVFLEPGHAAREPALHAEEPRPVELSGTPRQLGLEGTERRRFSASELMTRLHSSLRLGRSSAARALASGAGTGAGREGTATPWDPGAARESWQGGTWPTHWTLSWAWGTMCRLLPGLPTLSSCLLQGKHLEESLETQR